MIADQLILNSNYSFSTEFKLHVYSSLRGSFFMFVESGCISTNIEFTVP